MKRDGPPASWAVIPLKRVSRIRYGLGQPPREKDGGTPLLRATNVDHGHITDGGLVFVDAEDVPSGRNAVLRAGEIIVVRSGAYTGDSAIIPSRYDGALAGYDMVVSIQGNHSPYFAWQLLASNVGHQFQLARSRAAQPHLNAEELGETQVYLPPLSEQLAIADFLDRETARIDALIAKQEELIERIEEKRRAVINHAVTRGLDPNVPMKDSGVPWIGKIPDKWQAKPLKYMTGGITVGIVVTPSKYYADVGIPALRSLNVGNMKLSDNDLVFIDEKSNQILEKSILNEGDLVSVRTGKPGTTAVVDKRFDGANCIDLIIIRRSSEFDPRYLGFVLNSELAHAQYSAGSEGAIQQHFNIETAKSLLIPWPSAKEQILIREFLDHRMQFFSTLTDRTSQAIDRLREHRTALITAAVTGQIDVAGRIAGEAVAA